MPAPFAGAVATEATAVPWNSSRPNTVWSFANVVSGRPENSGCEASTPLSTIVIGTPGPGGVTCVAPTSARYHSCPASGSSEMRPVAAAAVPEAHSAAANTMISPRRTAHRAYRYARAVPRAYVALGSNLGDRRATLLAAVDALAANPDVDVVAVSTLVETDPVGLVDQPRFLNGAAAVDTTLAARELLALLLDVEHRFGRTREGVPAQGPRTLDLDLLLYGDEQIEEPGLRIPHPRLPERAFVLEPLAELDPALEVPGKGTIQALMARLHST